MVFASPGRLHLSSATSVTIAEGFGGVFDVCLFLKPSYVCVLRYVVLRMKKKMKGTGKYCHCWSSPPIEGWVTSRQGKEESKREGLGKRERERETGSAILPFCLARSRWRTERALKGCFHFGFKKLRTENKIKRKVVSHIVLVKVREIVHTKFLFFISLLRGRYLGRFAVGYWWSSK